MIISPKSLKGVVFIDSRADVKENPQGERYLSVINVAERISANLEDKVGTDLVSVVVYGNDINREMKEASDYNLLVVLKIISEENYQKIHEVMGNSKEGDFTRPLVMAEDEIDGMMDSVPETFLEIMLSYQTVYGKTLFKGLSSLNQEYLRSQTERSLREYLFCARILYVKGLADKDEMMDSLLNISDLLYKSIRVYHILSKPWIGDEQEHMDSFFEEFPEGSLEIKKLVKGEISEQEFESLKKIGFYCMTQGIKPILDKVDEMGP